MKPAKLAFKETNLIDLGTKKIYQYPFKAKLISVAKMSVKGRNPQGRNNFFLEHKCNFIIYIIKGTGKIYAGKETFKVGVGDCVYVPLENKFAVEGKLEYVTVDTPAFFPEQSEEIKV